MGNQGRSSDGCSEAKVTVTPSHPGESGELSQWHLSTRGENIDNMFHPENYGWICEIYDVMEKRDGRLVRDRRSSIVQSLRLVDNIYIRLL